MSFSGVINFFDANAPFDLPPEQAVEAFQARGLKPTFDWRDALSAEREIAFTIAKMLSVDLLRDVQESLTLALNSGETFEQWADRIIPELQARGWWGRKSITDPVTGETVVARLGTPYRLRTIFRTNMASAYAEGQWLQMQQQAEEAPYLLYDAVDDTRTRAEHAQWDDLVLPMSSSFFKTHYPPNGYNCRCSVIQLDADDLERMGIEPRRRAPTIKYENWTNPRTGRVERVPEGVDPGFDNNPGMARAKELRKLLAQKVAALPPEARRAAGGIG